MGSPVQVSLVARLVDAENHHPFLATLTHAGSDVPVLYLQFEISTVELGQTVYLPEETRLAIQQEENLVALTISEPAAGSYRIVSNPYGSTTFGDAIVRILNGMVYNGPENTTVTYTVSDVNFGSALRFNGFNVSVVFPVAVGSYLTVEEVPPLEAEAEAEAAVTEDVVTTEATDTELETLQKETRWLMLSLISAFCTLTVLWHLLHI